MSNTGPRSGGCPFAYIANALQSSKPHHHCHPSTSSSASSMSLAPDTPSRTPSFEPNAPAVDPVPAIVGILKDLKDKDPREGLAALELSNLDLSLPVSNLLKEGTSRAHIQAENSDGAAALVKGELELQEYIRFLVVLWRIYDALELGLTEFSTNPVLAPTYDPAVLARANSLARDITFLQGLLPETITSTVSSEPLPKGPLPPFAIPAFIADIFSSPPAPLTTYLDHLNDLASSDATAPGLLAHAYVRYLGDLSGGQFIAARVKKAYRLEGLDGVRFYHFDLQSGAEESEASRADGKRKAAEVKDWFRKGMDEGTGDDETLKATLVREANLAFALNTYLFSTIRTKAGPPAPIIPTHHPDGTPLRYYERRALEQEWKEKQRLLTAANNPPKTWTQRAETFAIFMATVAVAFAVTQYVIPAVGDFAANQLGLSLEDFGLGALQPKTEL